MLNVLYEKKMNILFEFSLLLFFLCYFCFFNFMIIIILIKNVFEYKFNKNY